MNARAALGLDQPLLVQLAVYLGDVVRGDLGTSIAYNRSALNVVMERVPATLELGIPALIASIALGIPLGIITAYGRNRWYDRLIMSMSLAGQSLPSFLSAFS
ncbi:MAG: ABC transporter permease [Chloroflexi bacterium]|nr:ABC transporter permease [Chloroflexota bacterium]